MLPRSQVELAAPQPQAPDVVELRPEVVLVDEVRQRHVARAVDQAELDLDVGVAAEHRLQHQELVEVGVEQRAHDRVDAPAVVVHPGRDVGHAPIRRARRATKATPAAPIAASAAACEPSRSISRQASSTSVTAKPSRAASSRREVHAEIGGEPGQPDRR